MLVEMALLQLALRGDRVQSVQQVELAEPEAAEQAARELAAMPQAAEFMQTAPLVSTAAKFPATWR